ncbi:hypothetical protein Leef1_44 [Polaribacter phage Leef_1]|uniref:Uncharacterized protein n=1 Tax=Polaribacter phage Leef_1 TaxID=2745684 RepID=A0A8E4ZFW7_9CAUD|nr:hypothetical protein M1M28_gp44 [Polaribacter phage Leef_1]QQV91410.1 hypothetical protein Leef1_44 [Polaribacter phage Leef_1]
MSQDTINTDNLDFCANTENVPGVSPMDIFACPVSEFLTIDKLPAKDAVTDLAAAATIVGPHTFEEGKGFFKISVLPETGMVESSAEGEKGSKSWANSFAGTLPNISAKSKGFLRKYQNVPMIFVIPQLNGDNVQLGSATSPAFMTEATPSTGAKAGDVVGVPLKFADVQGCPAPIYDGTITEFTPAV